MKPNQKLELTWIGKGEEPKLEPRILIEQPEYSCGDPGSGNMLIQGDNLLALKALEQDYAGKVKCIYIDPPYNTGNAFEHYDDGIEHSQWLNLMAPRLKILRDLLANDGSIWISIDDDESHYLKVLCDEIFGRRNFVNNVIWEKKYSPQNDAKWLSDSHDHILVYAKNKEIWRPYLLPRTEEMDKRYKNYDNDLRGLWKSSDLSVKTYSSSTDYPIQIPSGRIVNPPAGYSWRVSKEKFEELVKDNRIWFGKDGNNVPSIKRFLSDVQEGLVSKTIWYRIEVGDNQDAKREGKQFNSENVFATPKPEKLVYRIMALASREGDLVLDSFLGSGTTAAVVHKMGRKWIGIELGEHAKTHCYSRLKQVVDGTDQGGISKAVEWQGGGGFRFYTLAPSLLNRDKYGNWIISKKYNPDMLAAAMAKQEGFRYLPDEHVYWKQARSSEKDFLFTTTGFMTVEMLDGIHEEMQPDESLLLACKAYQKECAHRYPNISIKKIPNMLLGRCEFGREDYSLNIVQVPYDRAEEEVPDEPELAIESEEVEESRQTDLFE
ncbi:site-specific DNA-methyltransferase [Pelodictyon phaeoclathratiforme]|jgi:adenine-specific DNA-methyltransferase|uniref:site-specific DNA-methyltransferase (adenine-specific) n=1 Tax=Pelodictyon phaeoclathratiforme (strain DSM 5477 / BU-1) TaxID=324925 RepID=B4SCI7_PELPB|nr:site-specific DNA-methyltransferase [Pelodictyon phaeoclathratiforme]ACF44192.1 DNA methylase N-4/N-6 domain protein [Pelodictyon phaeoclathratiforme BU-1]MBV5288559.1 site-specific DNA-methyltransferase [Pelodictyon phaeoclathratiforme]